MGRGQTQSSYAVMVIRGRLIIPTKCQRYFTGTDLALGGGLTVKLRGRTEAPARRRGRTLSSSARGAKQTTHHGPLQRLLCGIALPPAVRSHPDAAEITSRGPARPVGFKAKRLPIAARHFAIEELSIWPFEPVAVVAVCRVD